MGVDKEKAGLSNGEAAPQLVFSGRGVAESYLFYRPAPPPALISAILSHWNQNSEELPKPEGSVLVDVGCGSGQSTHLFAPYFSKVVGVDVSSDMVEEGRQRYADTPNLTFTVGDAHQLPVPPSSVDVLSVCAAIHWLDLDKFYAEADRVLVPGGVLAVYSYVDICPHYKGKSLRPIIKEIRDGVGFFSPGHYHLLTEFTQLPQLYSDDVYLKPEDGSFDVEFSSDMEGMMGYYSSFAPLLRYAKEHGEESARRYQADARTRILAAVGEDAGENPALQMKYSYFLRMWRKPRVLNGNPVN